jgi:hypothetical protein
MNYREADTTVDREIDALKDLLATMRRERRRVAPLFALARRAWRARHRALSPEMLATIERRVR